MNNPLVDVQMLYRNMRYNDYSFENGLGEIIDNSVEAGAGEIEISFVKKQKRIGKKEIEELDRITVADNGCGMDYETISRCLVPGCSSWEQQNGRHGIGRFGMGLLLGSLSIARRVEVYSRDTAYGNFYSVCIDLDKIHMKGAIPVPTVKSIPPEYKLFFEGRTGTIVILSECDRIGAAGRKPSPNEVSGLMTAYLGRTYRKFIEAGLKMHLDGKPVYLHDPLYASGPTIFDTKEGQDPKAEIYARSSIVLPVPDGSGETAEVTVTISLLPVEWRAGNWSTDLKKRKVDQNEGISILRADREILYGKIPDLLKTPYQENDKWWGCEIAFPPELDDYFQIRCIKRGAEPVDSLRDKLNWELSKTIPALRRMIEIDLASRKDGSEQERLALENVERVMESVHPILPKGKSKKEETEEKQKIKDILSHSCLPDEGKKLIQDSIINGTSRYAIVPVKFPQQYWINTEFLNEK